MTNDLEYVGGRGLLLKRLTQLAEQPRVLNGDDGLRCEVRHQRDLLLSKWTNFLTVDADSADQHVVLEHWHGEECTHATQLDGGFAASIPFCVSAIG